MDIDGSAIKFNVKIIGLLCKLLHKFAIFWKKLCDSNNKLKLKTPSCGRGSGVCIL